MSPRTPLVRPDSYFAERDPDGLRVLALVVLLALAGPAAAYGIGWVLAAHLDGTVTVDNPERPPDWVCESDSDVHDRSDCDRPREVERDVDRVLMDAVGDLAGRALLALPLLWFLAGLGLHVGSWLADGEGGVAASFAVAAWGLVPALVGIPVVLCALYVGLDPVTVTPADDPSVVLEGVRRQIAALDAFGTAVSLLTTAWGAVIWRYGLEHDRGLGGAAATAVAGLVATPLALAALA